MTATALQNLIDGVWIDGSGARVVSVSPASPSTVVAEGGGATAADLDSAVAAANRAAAAWGGQPAHTRAAVLRSAASIIEANAAEWGAELALEEGKTRPEGVGEVLRAAQIFAYFGNRADSEAGELYNSPRSGERILVTRRPIGTVGIITPFNFPIAIPAWKIAPALAYGNTVVWKPAGTVPLLALRLAQALEQAGLPAGVLNLLIGDGAIGAGIVDHAGIAAVSFTGSTAVGRSIASAGALRGIAVQAEMGGKNAAVVLADADLELAVDQVIKGAFNASGQKCTATSRLILVDAIADAFLAELVRRTDALVVGDPLADGVALGPVVTAGAAETITAGIDAAIAAGAVKLTTAQLDLTGDLAAGHFVRPTVLELPAPTTGSSPDAAVWRDELFGPVIAAVRVADADEAFRLANDSEFGLSAAVFTNDLHRALSAVDHIDVGMLHINSETAGADPHVPFGGAKGSSLGPKEQGAAAREFYTHTTTVYLRGGL